MKTVSSNEDAGVIELEDGDSLTVQRGPVYVTIFRTDAPHYTLIEGSNDHE